MKHWLMRAPATFVLLAIVSLSGTVVYGQGSTTSTISGVVVDSDGGVVPGAEVVAKHTATAATQSATTNAEGAFSFPGLNIGTYTVTVTLQGFKTVVVKDVVLTSSAPANVRAVLEIGGLSEQVVVSSSSEIVQTQSATITSTINTNQITKLPLTSRSAMDFVNFLPGVSTPGGNRDATINGLPQGVINITLDGINIQDNTNRSTDGFFAIVSPRLDAIEEVSVTTAGQGGDAGQGAVQIKFVTRSGTNTFSGSGYHYYRSDKLNANTWFNNRNGVAKPKLKQNQIGVRAGGPIVIPGLYDGTNKAFFFVNYEELRQPSDTTRNRTLLNPAAQQGVFSYVANGVTQTVNVLDLAARNGQLATTDATIVKLVADIRAASGTTGALSTIDVNLDRLTYNVSVTSMRRFPTVRVDYNLTEKHRFSSAWNYNWFTDSPDTLNGFDPQFPGFPARGGQTSIRQSWGNTLRSTINQGMVNEARVGYSGSPVKFFDDMNLGMYSGSLANTKGYHLVLGSNTFSIGSQLTNAGATPTPQSRNASDLSVEDTLTWLKGSHNLTMGLAYTQYNVWLKNSNLVPRVAFGVLAADPANGLFTAANFPGASSTNITAASNLYALLTGRVASVTGDARLNESTGEYQYMGVGLQRSRMRESGLFLQDAWRLKQTLTINAGLRYDVQFPFVAANNSYSTTTIEDLCGVSGVASNGRCNLFQAGVQPGKHPQFYNMKKGEHAYNTDWNNVAPNVGFAWSPQARPPVLGALMGNEFVLRAGYARAFSRNGMGDFTGVYNANPGVTIPVTRSESNGNLGAVPLLLRNDAQLAPPAFSAKPTYPMTDVVSQDISMFDPDIQVPWADSWTAGVQRSISRNMVVEARYVGTRSREAWVARNYNEINIFENNFTNEFRLAQANLAANIAAGRGATFAYTGAAGTAPLPILLAFLNGQGASQASNAAAYSGTNWTNATLQAFMAVRNPNPYGLANNILGNATFRGNSAGAGLPANFFVANPDLLGGANLTVNAGKTDYHSMQLELRRRLSQGLQFQTSYVFGKAMQSNFQTFRRPQLIVRDTGTPGDLTHQFKANIVYDLPFGRGRRFGDNANGLVERLIGGWQAGITTRIQSGRLIDIGNVRPIGMSKDEIQSFFKLRFDNAGRKIYSWPQGVIDNTILAFSVSPTSATGYSGASPTGRYFAPANGPDCIEVDNGADYGDCPGTTKSLVLTGPLFRQTDLRISKRTTVVGRVNVEFAAELLNAFNQANFVPVSGIGNNIASYEVTALTGTNTARVAQLVSRINW
jgi:hypothetical protein